MPSSEKEGRNNNSNNEYFVAPAYQNIPRRRSQTDVEMMEKMYDLAQKKNSSLPSSLRSVNFDRTSLMADSAYCFQDAGQPPQHQFQKLRGGIQFNTSSKSRNGGNEKSLITQETLDRLREVELEDILMNARNITEPDSTANMSFCPQPAKVIEGTFRHSVAVRDVDSKTGAFKHRTIEILRNPEDDLGFSIRQGDGWEKQEGIFISRLSLGSVYDKFELMNVGDEIVKVNRVEVKTMDVDSVIRVMHIPEKLSLTIKMLTPFSKKRVSKSTIASDGKNKANSKHVVGLMEPQKTMHGSNYKIAQMKIGMSTDSAKKKTADSGQRGGDGKKTDQLDQQTKKDEAAKTSVSQQQSTGRSPYRVGGGTTPRPLSPIRETTSEEANKPAKSTVHVTNTRRTSVTWLDQRNPKCETTTK
eukprot:gene18089-19896_t